MARIRVLQQAQALYIRQNSLAVGLQRQYGLSPAVTVPRRSLKTTVSCLQQKETSEVELVQDFFISLSIKCLTLKDAGGWRGAGPACCSQDQLPFLQLPDFFINDLGQRLVKSLFYLCLYDI